jgi:hypothetical protein
VGSIEKRLERLEEWTVGTAEDEEECVSQEALRRVTTEDLLLLHAYLERATEEGGEPTEEEEAAILRYEEIKEEVRGEH